MENENVDPIYKKGFEHGYWLQSGDSPELRNVMRGSAKHAGYYSGLAAGSKEALREKAYDRLMKIHNDAQKQQRKDMGMD